MSEIGYKDFPSDVDLVLNDFLKKHVFKSRKGEIDDDEMNYRVLYENKNSIIEFDLLGNFPHIGVSIMIYLKENKTKIMLESQYVNSFLGVKNEEVEGLYKSYLKKVDENNLTYRKIIINDLLYLNLVLNNLWFDLLNGTYSYGDFSKWLRVIQNEYENFKSEELPSFKELNHRNER